VSCSEGRQWQVGAREVVEVGGRECELRAGWIRRMFSQAQVGLVWSGLCLGTGCKGGRVPTSVG
jgi:hypothetical protein